MNTLLKVLETLRVLAGIGAPLFLIWGVVTQVDWDAIIQIIGLIISIIGSSAFAVSRHGLRSYLVSKKEDNSNVLFP